MSEEWNAEAAGALLNAFRLQVPKRSERPQTFMEISGYSHYENVCSNILAFFFDPGKPHGLGTLFLDSLARIGGIEDQGASLGGDVEIHREVHTGGRNFIDILIKTGSYAIVIENKIFAGADYNPLDDYAKHISTQDQPNKCKFLLTLKPIAEYTESEIGKHGFKNVTYRRLVDEIRGLLGKYISSADTRYLTFMLDFLNTLDNLQGGIIMNLEFSDFIVKNGNFEEAKRFIREIETFKSDLRASVKRLESHIDVSRFDNVRQWLYRDKNSPFHDVLVHDIKVSSFEYDIAIGTVISFNGWEVWIHPRNENSDEMERLGNLLQSLEIPVKPKKSIHWEPIRFVHQQSCKDAAALEEIAPIVEEVVCKLARHNGAS